MRIVIVGAGVAGCIVAKTLSRLPGAEVICLERVSADDQSDSGTGLNIGPNSVRALQWHDPDLLAKMDATSFKWESWRTSLTDGTVLFHLPLSQVADNPGRRIRWSELYRLLRAPVAGCTRNGHALEALEEDAAGRLVPVFRTAEGLRREGGFDLLVGADGRYSRLRALAAGEPEGTLLGVCIWRLLVTDAADCPYDDYGQWFNGNARLLSFRVPGGAVYIAGTFPLPVEGQVTEAMKTAEAQRALFTPADGAPCPAVAWMLDKIAAHLPDIHWARSATVPVLRHALDGRALFLGDAAQAMVPTLGQGATQAVECGVVAARVLRAGGDAKAVAAARDARVDFVRDFSLAASDTLLPPADVVAGTRKKMGPDFVARLRRLYTEVD